MIYIVIPTIIIVILLFARFFGEKVYSRKQKEQTENDPVFQQIVNDMKMLVTIITNIPEHYLTVEERIDIKRRIESTLKNIVPFRI